MTGDQRELSLLQVSDVYLDWKPGTSRALLPAVKRQQRNEETFEALSRALEFAVSRKVDAVVIPGNLLQSQAVTSSTMARVVELFASAGDIPILLSPGPSDPWTPECFYNANVLSAWAIRPWSSNVHIFQSASFEVFQHPKRADVQFIGRACQASASEPQRIFDVSAPRLDKTGINIGVFAGHLQVDSGSVRKTTEGMRQGPPTQSVFTGEDLLAADFTYCAVGADVNYQQITAESGKMLGTYAGSLTGKTLEEVGSRHALLVKLTPLDDGRHMVTIEPQTFDQRKIVIASCSINGVRTHNIADHVRKALDSSGARPDLDIVCLRVTGTFAAGAQVELVDESTQERFFHLILDDRTRPDYLSEKFDERTTEGRFVHLLQELKRRAEAKGGILSGTEYGDISARTIEDALYYGLDALKQGRVVIKDVD